MQNWINRLFFFLFIASGFCGLLYQVIWLRLAFATFGIATPVLSVVVSIFMVGLAVGSWGGGRVAGRFLHGTLSPLWLYMIIELGIGIGAFAVPWSFRFGENMLRNLGELNSIGYLAASAPFIALAIFPWCCLMGMTFPAVMAYFKKTRRADTSFSFLYLANVIGAMAGALVTAVFLVEFLGFSRTLFAAAITNFAIAGVSSFVALRDRSDPLPRVLETRAPLRWERGPAVWILFLTGFVSMAMEVVWTRSFTPVLKTNIYAFAMLLTMYLLATWVGSLRYRKALARGRTQSPEKLLSWMALSALLPVLVNDPRLYLQGVGALLSIFPLCAVLGYLTPMLVDQYSNGDPRRAGFAYGANTLGCVLGPLVAGYLLLPFLGIKASLILLALPFFLWVLIPGIRGPLRPSLAMGSVVALALALGPARSYEEQAINDKAVVRRDHTATVISTTGQHGKNLLVNGIGITLLHTVTKLMSHVPLSFVPHKPEKALVICFGMGTTFRSAMSWGIETTAAELVPSVRDAFGYYFSDAANLLSSPKAHVVIDDGRRFLRRSRETFDVITLDPPPPIQAAGSSLLYSVEFYEDAKARLHPEGVLQQWVPGHNLDAYTRSAMLRSIQKAFPYVRTFAAIDNLPGYHFLASRRPIHIPSAEALAARMPETAQRDLLEWVSDPSAAHLLSRFLQNEIPTESLLQPEDKLLTDDRPLNEYYVVRRFIQKMGY